MWGRSGRGTFVRKEHFDEHVLRIDERFLSLEKRMEQGFAHAEKSREQNLVQVNQRFEDLEKRFDGVNQRFDGVNQRFDGLERRMEHGFSELRADMRQMRNWLVWLFGLVVFGFIGSILLIMLRGLLLE